MPKQLVFPNIQLGRHENNNDSKIFERSPSEKSQFQLVCTGQGLLDPFLPQKILGEFGNNMFTITCVYYACSALYSDQRFAVKWETLLERESEKMSTIQAQRWSLRLVKNYFQVNRKPDNQ